MFHWVKVMFLRQPSHDLLSKSHTFTTLCNAPSHEVNLPKCCRVITENNQTNAKTTFKLWKLAKKSSQVMHNNAQSRVQALKRRRKSCTQASKVMLRLWKAGKESCLSLLSLFSSSHKNITEHNFSKTLSKTFLLKIILKK